jgi:dipeptidyl aminopeptidase/acylaminoacyl peptidase
MGASFGGYAAEWAAVRNPDIYRCAISLAGVSDIAAQLKYDRKSFVAARYYRNWRDRVQGSDGIDLDSISPAKRAADLKVPILIAHGDADTNVPPIQSKMLADALTKLGRPPEYYVYKGEGHGFTKPEDQIDFLKKVEAFLAKYNPA